MRRLIHVNRIARARQRIKPENGLLDLQRNSLRGTRVVIPIVYTRTCAIDLEPHATTQTHIYTGALDIYLH